MKRIFKWLPYALAALIVAACYGGIELSQVLLNDHRGELREVEQQQDPGMLYLDYRANDTLWPWNEYEAGEPQPVPADDVMCAYTTDLASALLNVMSGVCPEPDADLGAYLEVIPQAGTEQARAEDTQAVMHGDDAEADHDMADDTEIDYDAAYAEAIDDLFYSDDLYFLHDVGFRADDGEKYVLNLAFNRHMVLYYSCVAEWDRGTSFEENNAACEYLNEQFREFRDAGGAFDTYGGEYYQTDINCFENYVVDLRVYQDNFMGTFGQYGDMVSAQWDLLTFGNSSGISSDGSILNMELYGNGERLVLFFGPGSWRFVGFSLRPE